MTEDKSRKKRWLVWGMVVSIVVLLFSPFLIFRAVNRAKFNRKVAELKAAGQPVSMDDLEAAYVLPEGVENAADVYEEAFRAYVEPNETAQEFLPVSGTYVRGDDMPPYPAEVMEAVRVRLEENAECLELLDRAARMEHCLFPRTRDFAFFNIEALMPLKKVCQLLTERNLYLAQTGQTEALYESTVTTLGLTNGLGQQPMVIDHLVMIAVQALGASSLEDSVNVVQFTEAQLAVFQRQLRAMQPMRTFADALISERAWTIELTNLTTKDAASSLMLPDILFKVYSVSGLKEKDAMLLLDHSEKQLQIVQLPCYQQTAGFKKLDAELASYSGIHWMLLMEADNARLNSINLRVEGGIRCVEMAMAVERFRLKYGKLPEGLGELVPEFLEEVYLDPFDGKPLRYVLRPEGGYMIYCVGEDCIDNGGADYEHRKLTGGAGSTPAHDWPFTVRR